MGVGTLWKQLAKAGAVHSLDGAVPEQHERICAALENRVVAIDLSAWLVQAQTQPALLEHYENAYARATKVVFERVRAGSERPQAGVGGRACLGMLTSPAILCTALHAS